MTSVLVELNCISLSLVSQFYSDTMLRKYKNTPNTRLAIFEYVSKCSNIKTFPSSTLQSRGVIKRKFCILLVFDLHRSNMNLCILIKKKKKNNAETGAAVLYIRSF